MGVPKFFRYISERYPCLSEFVKEYQIPVFDNLYLDMNGIIHMCSHPDDNNPHFRITEEKIFADIFHYIEVLFRMIKPQKVFFMAVDGVAPRAKMNQQRGRRFRSAKDAEKLEKEAVKKGETLPEGVRFDSNCITPGTEFMARLQEQLKYFVVQKISTDRTWKKCKVIFSGHETPGEGEHKIMDYIRYIRSQPGYDPNTRHCLYGLDADLIMLGLCTHDPHFSLLREEVKFGRKAKRSNVPEEIRFYLLHLSLMREYLELEFSSLKNALRDSETFKFDIEKIIDDWILMGFLVGNDFIPNLPNLHISNGALPVLYEVYIQVLPTLGGYINEAGTLNLERFEKFMKKLAEIDVKNFEEIQDDLLYMKMKTGRKFNAHASPNSKNNDADETDFQSAASYMDPQLAALIQATDDLDVSSGEDDSEQNNSSIEDEAFKCFKDDYYRSKMEFQKVTPEVMREQAEGYVRAIQWNLNYYYNGVCSWSWFYPHHYSPYISDIKGFSDLRINFELGQPFKPYEQLLAVLPTASKNLLPKSYHDLMTNDNSLIKQYYPEEFQTDLNGKRQEWEAVVLVPFIDENVLLEAMKPCNEQLSAEELKRNFHGPMLVYKYSEDDLGVYNSPEYFPKVLNNHAECIPISIEDIRVSKEKLIKGAYPGALFDVFYPGFPTLKHLKFSHKLKKAKVKVFEMPSRNENMVLRIMPNDLYFEDSIPEDLLGKIVWIGWPHLVEAKVVAISNRKYKYVHSTDEDSDKKFEVHERTGNVGPTFDNELDGIVRYYRERMGVDFGETKVLIHVKPMVGRKYVFTSSARVNLEKQFSSVISHFPLQGIVCDLKVHDDSFSAFREISDIFPPGTLCFSLTNPYYGSQGTILDSEETLKNNQLKVSLCVYEEPDFSPAFRLQEKLKNSYMSLTNSASQLALSNYVFSRVTGSLYISTRNFEGGLKSVNIGLDLKFNKKNQETPGYTRKIENTWLYTDKAVGLVREYLDQFPEVFDYLSKNNSDDLISDQIFGTDESDEKVKLIQTWLRTLPTHNIERRICGSSVLDPEIIATIEKIISETNQNPKVIVMSIKPQFLYKPEIQVGNLAPDSLALTRIFDRIVNVREGYTVPLGLKGTVVAVHKPSDALDNNDELFDIVFDEPFTGGMVLNCSEHKGYRLSKTTFINLSHGKRRMEERTGVPGALRALAKERKNGNNFQLNSNSNSNFNIRQQNSAFASFNKTQPSVIMPNINVKSAGQYNQNQYQFRPQHPTFPQQPVTNEENKVNKNSFHYMADFSRNYDKGVNDKKNNDGNHESKQMTKQQFQKPISSEIKPVISSDAPAKAPKTHVDTDFLKKILKIQNLSSNPKPNDTNGTNIIDQVGSLPGPSHNVGITTSASARLLSYYQSNSLGCPRYTYLEHINGIAAQIVLPHGNIITGKIAETREGASENVASEALNMLQTQPEKLTKPGVPDFPVPPKKWVQERPPPNKMPSQVYFNRSYQVKPNGGGQYPKAGGEDFNRSPGNKNVKNQGDAYPNTKHNTINTTNFVPLQALKKRQVTKTTHNTSRNRSETSGQNVGRDKTDMSQSTTKPTSKEQSADKSPRKAENRRQHRKTRIAANFVNKN